MYHDRLMRACDHKIDIPDYDDAGAELLPLSDWIEAYAMKTGKRLNIHTMRKRRYIANIGRLVPPKTFLLTREEFEAVMVTPLPMCKRVEP